MTSIVALQRRQKYAVLLLLRLGRVAADTPLRGSPTTLATPVTDACAAAATTTTMLARAGPCNVIVLSAVTSTTLAALLHRRLR